MTRGTAILLGLGVLGLGGLGYLAFQAAGFEGFSAGIAAEAVLIVLVLGWTGSYLFRVVTGNMTYMQQRRSYRAAYDAETDDVLQRKFDALPLAEQEKLLKEVGQLQADTEL
ncbi:DUF3007 family protein [Cyanobium sp. Morenito 9A2]|uniref:DUF3007 family protein n=1 Tax=Cyanobium sp. Morenito 9A2 TaxID=2823718 RepID=UPI0020CC5435|nr:DUF3007 family protein [Cyanobium sp. Morenito 9A2]MCP9848469.1 DUF3007 family protein [Cyanobium sp. Morenito 9A2]